MTQISAKERNAAARAARAYIAGGAVTRTTRANPSPRHLTITEIAAVYHAGVSVVKKYISLLRAGKSLPSGAKGGQPRALTDAEELALVIFIRTVEKSAFAVTEPAIRNYATYLRKHRKRGPKTAISKAWVRRFKARHPELQHRSPKIKEIIRAGAELDVPRISHWFEEFEAVFKERSIKRPIYGTSMRLLFS